MFLVSCDQQMSPSACFVGVYKRHGPLYERIIATILQGGDGADLHQQQLAVLSKALYPPGPRGSIAVTQVVTHMTHEPESQYEYAERMRSDALHINDVSLIVSVLNVLKSRTVDIAAGRSATDID